ncbi:MAG: GNAT family N-acetyltransferase, partial [Candidatus Thermoplasmatota archaeon]|nr:GNAT family N-acetyltransferase [Candidatus Thermoplasmatota archaeon]
RVNDVVEIGYFVAEDHQGHGLMTRAVGAFVDHLFLEEGMNRVSARIMTENGRSRALVERLGLSLEGVHREEYKLRGEYKDMTVYSILRPEWKARNG